MGARSPTIVDLSTLLPGAFCTRVLAQAGWRVVKVEPPGGDILRTLDPELYEAANPGKEIVEIDLKDTEGRERLHRLVGEADALLESFRPAAAARLGIVPDELWTTRPRLVVASLRGYPHGGSADRPGHDINYMAAAGAAALCADAQGRPVYWGLQVSNFAGGLTAAFAIQSAVLMPQAPGRRHIEIDLTSVLASWNLPRALAARRHAGDASAFREFVAPPGYGFYATADGRWVALGVREPKFRRNLMRALGLASLDTHADVAAAVRGHGSDTLERLFADNDVPFAWACPPDATLDEPAPGVFGDLCEAGEWRLGIGGLERWTGRAP